MGSNKALAFTVLFLSLNLLLFSRVSAANCPATSNFAPCATVLATRSFFQPCCSLLDGLVDLDAAVCLCAPIQANILGINLDVDVAVGVILNACGKTPPSGSICTN